MAKYRLSFATVAAGVLLVISSTAAVHAGFDFEPPQPNAAIRLGSGPDVGTNVVNTTAAGQTVIGAGAVGQKLTFWITIRNAGPELDSFKVQRSAGYTNGYRVRYYNALGKDVTGKVNAGTFTTPDLAPNEEYVMRATAKIRWLATAGSSTSRRVTVSSVEAPSMKDTVRFIAALDFPSDADVTLDPGDLVGTDDYDYEFQTAEVNGQAVFTLENVGTDPSRILLVALAHPGNYGLSNDGCTSTSLAAGGTCSFQVDFVADTDCGTLYLGDITVYGGSGEYLHLQLIAVCDLI